MSKPKTAPKRKANGYQMPDPLPKGEVLQDLLKNQWRLGPSIGKGGFGEIYSAQQVDAKGASYPYVVKIEPHANGPLFVEMNFYCRNAKQVDIDAFKESKKIKSLGMPAYVGSGSHEHKGKKYRFVVMEKFATDIWKLYLTNNKKFPEPTAYRLGLQMIDVLEYIHSKGYVHADIKGANILLGVKNPDQAYLVDFGLAGRFTTETNFKPNPKKMHDGTIEYVSRDAHQGVQTRRGDIEILVYNIMHWLGCELPWEKKLSDPKIVHAEKEKFMSDIPLFVKTCFEKSSNTDAITQLLKCVNTIKFNEAPDYDKIRKIFRAGLKVSGGKESGPLQFKSVAKRKSATDKTTPSKRPKKKAVVSDDDDEEDVLQTKNVRSSRNAVKRTKEPSNNGESESDEEESVATSIKKKSNKGSSGEDSDGQGDALKNTRGKKKVMKPKGGTPESSGEESDDQSDIPKKTRGRKMVTKPKSGKHAAPQSCDEESDDPDETPKKVRGRKNITPKLIYPQSSDSESDDPDDTPTKVKGRKRVAKTKQKLDTQKPKTSRTPTAPREENGVVHNREMMRIKNMVAEKQRKKGKAAKTKSPHDSDIVSNSEEEEELPIMSRRKIK